MGHKHHLPDYVTAFRFTSGAVGQFFIFRNPYDNKTYSFELIDCVSMPIAEVDEQLITEFHLKPGVAVEQIWCRIKMVVGFDECYSDIYTEEAEGPLAIGLQIKPEKEIGANAFTASALKAGMDAEVSWKLEIFRPEDSHA